MRLNICIGYGGYVIGYCTKMFMVVLFALRVVVHVVPP